MNAEISADIFRLRAKADRYRRLASGLGPADAQVALREALATDEQARRLMKEATIYSQQA